MAMQGEEGTVVAQASIQIGGVVSEVAKRGARTLNTDVQCTCVHVLHVFLVKFGAFFSKSCNFLQVAWAGYLFGTNIFGDCLFVTAIASTLSGGAGGGSGILKFLLAYTVPTTVFCCFQSGRGSWC